MSGFFVQSIRSPMIYALAATIGVALAAGALAEQTSGTIEPIMSRQMSFAIPFTVDRGPTAGTRQPAEVRLYVASEQDRVWRLHATAQPGQRRFMFRAPAEGEYRFRIATVQHSGEAIPAGGEGSRLRVIVDATAPHLQLEAVRGDAGQVSARWTIEEPHFEPEGATLQYRAGDDGPWQTVAVPRSAFRADGARHVGQVTWWPQPGHGPIRVRMEVLDTAGNRTISNATVGTSGPMAAGTGSSVSWPADRRVDTSPAAQGDIPTRVVDSRLFELEYDLSAVAAEDVTSVELWATPDRGRSWHRYQADRDHRSPLLVRVDEDGWYGFRIVVRNPKATTPQRPRDGQPPEILIRVDTQPPPVTIVSAGHGQGPDAGSLVVAWQADEADLSAHPARLLVARRADGPWTTMARDLPASGRFTIPVEALAGGEVYARVEVDDPAGNTGEAQTPAPISVDGVTPAMQVHDLPPLDNSPTARGPRRYIFR